MHLTTHLFIVCILSLAHWLPPSNAGLLPLTFIGSNNLGSNSNEVKIHDNNIADNSNTDDSNNHTFGYIEYQPNGTAVLLPSFETPPNASAQSLLLFKTIMSAIKLVAPLAKKPQPDSKLGPLNVKVYGDSVEHKFPAMLENIVQRIQSYFSVYRYQDTSQPFYNKPQTSASSTITYSAGSQPTGGGVTTSISSTSALTTSSHAASALTTSSLPTSSLTTSSSHPTSIISTSTAASNSGGGGFSVVNLHNSAALVDEEENEFTEFISHNDNDGFIIEGRN